MSKKASKLQAQLAKLPEQVATFYRDSVTETPEWRNLVAGEHLCFIADWKFMNSFENDWDGTIKENLPAYADYTPQTGLRFTSLQGAGSIVHRVNDNAYKKMHKLSEEEIKAESYVPVAVGLEEGSAEYACLKKEDKLFRVPDPEGLKACKNIKNTIAHALGATGKNFAEAIDEAMVNETPIGIRIEATSYNGNTYNKVVGFFPVSSDALAELDVDVPSIEGA